MSSAITPTGQVHAVAHKPGHALYAQMVSKLLYSQESWLLIGPSGEAAVRPPEQQYQPAVF